MMGKALGQVSRRDWLPPEKNAVWDDCCPKKTSLEKTSFNLRRNLKRNSY